MREWPLPEWQPGADVLKHHRQELLEKEYKLALFLLASEYDKTFLSELRDALGHFNELHYQTWSKQPLFLPRTCLSFRVYASPRHRGTEPQQSYREARSIWITASRPNS